MRNGIVNAKLMYEFSMVNTRMCQVLSGARQGRPFCNLPVSCAERTGRCVPRCPILTLHLASRIPGVGGYRYADFIGSNRVSDLIWCLSTDYRVQICPHIDS